MSWFYLIVFALMITACAHHAIEGCQASGAGREDPDVELHI